MPASGEGVTDIVSRLPFAGSADERDVIRRPRRRPDARSFAMTFLLTILVAAFLSPLLQTALSSLKSVDQVTRARSPIWPADAVKFEFEGEEYEVFQVPIDGGTRELALFKPGRQESEFIDPVNPTAPPVVWQGSWRTLDPVWVFNARLDNYAEVWDLIDYPRLLFNTISLAVIGVVGTVVSCTLVAYGFARFRFPGRGLLFTLLIATVFLPTTVTLIPTYMIFAKLDWLNTWLPLVVPAFFANAYDVFLIRQYLMTIPRDLDEAAAIDGAGPMRTLLSVILPQAWPVIIAVSLFHFVYVWNDFFGPLIYLSGNRDLWTISLGLSQFNGIYFSEPQYVQAGTMLALAVPVALFIVFQRVFQRGIVITGVDK
jgi:multiple sugar transport system permease protein